MIASKEIEKSFKNSARNLYYHSMSFILCTVCQLEFVESDTLSAVPNFSKLRTLRVNIKPIHVSYFI